MTRLSSIALRIALIIAVGISFVLTYMIMAHNTLFNQPSQDVVGDNTSTVQNSTVQSLGDVYLPIRVVYHDDVAEKLVYNRKNNLMANLQKRLAKGDLNAVGAGRKLSAKDYADRLNQKNSIMMIYPDRITWRLFTDTFKQSSKLADTDFAFDRLIFTPKGNQLQVAFLNDSTRMVRTATMKGEYTALTRLVRDADFTAQCKYVVLNDAIQLFFTKSFTMNPYSYLVSYTPDNEFVNNLMSQAETSNIESKSAGDATQYVSGSQKLIVPKTGHLVTYQSYGRKEAKSMTRKLENSFETLKSSGIPLRNIRYFGYDDNTDTVSFRNYVEGFPVFQQTTRGAVQITPGDSTGLLEASFANSNLQVPVPSDQAAATIMPTDQVITQMVQRGFKQKRIERIQLGYRWQMDKETDQVVDLLPTYYVRYAGQWQSLATWLKTDPDTVSETGQTTGAPAGSAQANDPLNSADTSDANNMGVR
ncbi:YycH family regulatory protein [Schleiferilactobacillus shenzhenensis]|uniref:YycH family regulatory protein n=1 Tax=Schleiferilactobacillus shenzhenensis TaxID=1231337 RepID=UPI0004050B3B|nr:two-component system activity regulator YycH [Schleiferilactobacillus shenzhenensis]